MSRKEYQKNKRKVKRNQKALLCGICMVIIIACISSGFAFRSKAEVPSTSFKYYTEIRVSRGMTLWDIAESYITPEYASCDAYIKEVKGINSIHGDHIDYGQYLMVPYYSEKLK